MRRLPLLLLLSTLTLVAPLPAWGNGTVPTGLHSTGLEGQVDRWFFEAMDAIYRGRPSEATEIAERMLRAVPQDPRPYLLQARILRLDVPDQNAEESIKGPLVDDIKKALEEAIEKSDQILERDPESLAGRLYRGWGNMFMAQMHALAKEYWSAGRKAKAGKEDLDFVLERDPGNADALMVQGVYLYFADILPGLVKFARVFLRVPGGHRLGGIEYIEAATLRQGYSHLDAMALLGVVLFGFEGRLEDAVPIFENILETYQGNVRILEPLAIISLFLPQRLSREHLRLQETLRTALGSPEPVERKVALRLSYYVALQEMLGGRIESARERLDQLRRLGPAEPDWLQECVLTSLVDIHRILGNGDAAEAIVASLPERSSLRDRLERRAGGTEVTQEQTRTLLELQPALRDLYAGDLQRAEAALNTVDPTLAPYVAYYRGEVELWQGQPESAMARFERVLRHEEKESPWNWFRFFAALRLAEAHGALQDRKAAVESLEKALDSREQKDLLRHVTRARKSYFEHHDVPGNTVRADLRRNEPQGAPQPERP